MRNLKHSFWILCAVLATACQPDLHFVEDSFRSVTAEATVQPDRVSILFDDTSGNATLEFESNKKWTAAFVNDRAADWCSLSSDNGRKGVITLVITVKQNDDYDERSASVILTCEDLTRTIVVTQKQKDALFLESSRIEMPCEGGSFSMTYRTNVDARVSVAADAADWIVPARTKGLSTYTETFTVRRNETLEPRQGNVEVTSALGTEVLTVYQAGEIPTLVLGSHEVELPAEGDGFSIQVTSNLDLSLTLRDDSWIHEVDTKTISTNTFYFVADFNEGRSERENLLVFSDQKRGMSDSVRIRQAYQAILAPMNPATLPSRSVDLLLTTVGGVPEDFKVVPSVSWMKLVSIEAGEEGCQIRLRSEDNPKSSKRAGVIRVYRTVFPTPDEVKVTQIALQPSFSFTTKRQEVKAPAVSEMFDRYILWGDGSFTFVPQMSHGPAETHSYAQAGKHTIVVESPSIPWLLVSEPENDTYFDFSMLKKKE